MKWPRAESILSERLRLVPLAVEHAEPMVEVLSDTRLYEYIGGAPPSLARLRRRYTAQAVGHSPDGTQGWLNWIVTVRPERPVGYVQATIHRTGSLTEAEIAWMIATGHQGQGIATEAAGAMIRWLRSQGVHRFVAHIAAGHTASEKVARHQGLRPTDIVEDGEIRWQSPA